MKLSNLFKKDTKTKAKANIQTLDKTQLKKVIGGKDAWEPHKIPGLDLPEQQ